MKHLKRTAILLAVLVLFLTMPLSVNANSAEPPGLIILVTGAPDDMTITLEVRTTPEEEIRVRQFTKLWEQQYHIYYHLDMQSLETAVIRVESGEKNFTCPLPAETGRTYRNVLTLDYEAQTLTKGQSPWRQPLLTALRITLTLLLEGLVFFLFGFRTKHSWIVFLAVNLLTQGWLNIVINGYAFSSGYWFLIYLLMEIGILIAESIAFPALTREKKKWLCVLYAVAANVLSLILGSQLIGRLPL